MKIFVYHTPELTPTDSIPDCAIVVDVLRATTTIATALNAGAEAVQVFSDIDELMEVSEKWPADKRLRVGERGGQKVEGCDLGNSPLNCTPEVVEGKRLFMTTTNGTRALQKVQNAPVVITSALVNRRTVVEYLMTTKPETIWIVASGWEGSFSLEDTACAGAIINSLCSEMGYPIDNLGGNDEVFGAVALYYQWQNQLYKLMNTASHGQRLARLECYDDLKYCADTDIVTVLPIQSEPGVLIKSKMKMQSLQYWIEQSLPL
ncbi:MAG: 2-phosphosulfolactate phosphatase family protein [Limnospira sp. PMC 1291.21]|uniref:Probable 2-phosphosulfolactate phosphatase n=2 Tax=Limnospira TaxID=2596745 RepID=B5VZN8_LIMMA|nr:MULTISPECIES: 2-phosphosulfolactate phosphatase family protein [Limnospira]EKD08836.1 2-phosphosulfolactate phosphatase [Arthrospira platensis C1]MDC0838053.1 2-phosphosulfolactate phosphatase family protein [Limnoraphis robusta]MDY7051068.1 2-phosphosulfolactate phosphatase family protein [Limnospira fusiformis LS22]QJB29268.1 2-phosphosulfolactate phosphatase family protein [Limnospira fusiformis SAG 85.79]EDZ95263.1 2-phosphosulfolactate phosphatase [Limnospira maxima CS-328]